MGYLTDIAETIGKYRDSTQPEYNRQRFARERALQADTIEKSLAAHALGRDPSNPAFQGDNIDLTMALEAIQPTVPRASDTATQQAISTMEKPYTSIPLAYKDPALAPSVPDQRNYQDVPYPSANEKMATAAATTDMVPRSKLIPLFLNPLPAQGYDKPAPLVSAISEAERLKSDYPGGVEVSGKTSSSGATPDQQNEAYQIWLAGNKDLRKSDTELAIKKGRLAIMKAQAPLMAQKAYSQADYDSYRKDMEDLARDIGNDEKTNATMREKADASAQKMATSTKIEQAQMARIDQARVAKAENKKALDEYHAGKLTLDRLKLLVDNNNKMLDRDAKMTGSVFGWLGSSGGMAESFATGNVPNIMQSQSNAMTANAMLGRLNQSQLAGMLSKNPQIVEAAIGANVHAFAQIERHATLGLKDAGVDVNRVPGVAQIGDTSGSQGGSGLTQALTKSGAAPITIPSFRPAGGVWDPGFLVGGGSTVSARSATSGGGTKVPAPEPSTPREKVGGGTKIPPPVGSEENPIVKGPGVPKPKSGQWYISPITNKPTQMP